MADLKVGTNSVLKVMYGANPVSKVYRGSTLVWEIIIVAPSTPTNVAASAITDNSMTISWDSVPTATSYDIQFREQGQAWTDYNGETGLSKVFSGLTANTTYEFQVRATNSGGSSSYSAMGSQTTNPISTGILEAIINFNYPTLAGAGVNYTNISESEVDSGSPKPLLNLSDGSASSASWVKTGSSGVMLSLNYAVSALDGYDSNSYNTAIGYNYAGASSYFNSKLTGLNPTKTYTIKIVSIIDLNTSTTTITVGGSAKQKGDVENVVLTWTGVSPDGAGDLEIDCKATYLGVIDTGGAFNIIHIIEE